MNHAFPADADPCDSGHFPHGHTAWQPGECLPPPPPLPTIPCPPPVPGAVTADILRSLRARLVIDRDRSWREHESHISAIDRVIEEVSQ
jgi:hypothetical protein